MGSIENFYAEAQKKEFARAFQFQIQALGPFTENDLLYVTTTTLPAKTVQNIQVPYMGLNFNIPGTTMYDGSEAWQVEFYCDEGTNIRNKMEAWINQIFNDATSTGQYGVPTEVATMDLLGKDRETLRRYEFTGLYPVTVGELAYDITNNGEVLKLPLTFAYQYWRTV